MLTLNDFDLEMYFERYIFQRFKWIINFHMMLVQKAKSTENYRKLSM